MNDDNKITLTREQRERDALVMWARELLAELERNTEVRIGHNSFKADELRDILDEKGGEDERS